MGAKPSFITVQCPTVGMQPIDDPELSRDTCVLSAAGLRVNSFTIGQWARVRWLRVIHLMELLQSSTSTASAKTGTEMIFSPTAPTFAATTQIPNIWNRWSKPELNCHNALQCVVMHCDVALWCKLLINWVDIWWIWLFVKSSVNICLQLRLTH